MFRKLFCVANFKMNKNRYETNSYLDKLTALNNSKPETNIIICPPYTSLDKSIDNISLGAQNINSNIDGAYTGEISAQMVSDFNVEYVILGHSERRIYNKETNESIKKCAQFGIKSSLSPIICVGENLDQRENGKAIDFIEKQITDCLPEDFNELIIAYEPIWSIGTGKIPRKSEIREMHKNIKEIVFSKLKKNVKVLYGGSVNEQNIQEILSVNNVDGVLVGGASLKIKDFLAIYGSAVKHLKKNYNI